MDKIRLVNPLATPLPKLVEIGEVIHIPSAVETLLYWWANDFQGPLLHVVELLEVRLCRASPDQGSVLHDWSHEACIDRKQSPGSKNT